LNRSLGFKSPAYVLYGLVTVAGAATIGTSILLYSYVAQMEFIRQNTAAD
jgi:hypothetical protein